jgi:hypothetical protein
MADGMTYQEALSHVEVIIQEWIEIVWYTFGLWERTKNMIASMSPRYKEAKWTLNLFAAKPTTGRR